MVNSMNKKQYEKISAPFRSESKKKILLLLNKVITLLGYISYPILVILVFIYQKEQLLRVIMIPAIGFLLLTLIRKGINRKRPYETLNIHPLIIKDKKGNSMPSRHVFSMTIIAVSWFIISPIVGIIFIICSIMMAMIRVIGGVHYPSDVLVGFISACLWGLWYLL